jgi:hypothetical protein
MATALDIITDSLIDLGAIDPIEALTSDESSHGLRKLNELLESWSNESLAVYQILQENFALTSGTASYTIGSGATFNTTRPLNVLSGFIRDSGIDYPLRILNREEYDQIQQKTTQYQPEYLFYSPSVANGIIYLYGVPAKNYSVTDGLWINSSKQLQSFSLLTTTVVLPPGYLRAIKANLSIELAPAYKRKPSEELKAIARESKANVKRLNSRTPKLSLAHMALHAAGNSGFNINTGY